MQATVPLDSISTTWPILPSSLQKHSPMPIPDHSISDDNDSTDVDDDTLLEEYSCLPVHADGVPSCDLKLVARNYRSREFGASVFEMLTTHLGLPGWVGLPAHSNQSISIYKVGGSLTNAVFFVSCPLSPSSSTPSDLGPLSDPPPTVLLRIYGPSSGSLISRKHELHLLHTLSTQYGIGPRLLGTFFNGRVEQFFVSRPLSKLEVRDPRVSRWIARKMAELHSVELAAVMASDDDTLAMAPRSHSTEPTWASFSSSASSHMSSARRLSTQSSGSETSAHTKYLDRTLVGSPALYGSASPLTAINSPELHSINLNRTRHSLHSGSITSTKAYKPRAGVWNNITRWKHEATKVFTEASRQLKGLNIPKPTEPAPDADFLTLFRASAPPLSSAESLANYIYTVDLPRLILEMKAYRAWVHAYEKLHGRSPRVFSHNDAQCGNLLLRQDEDAVLNERPHDQILVIDFEYASANPRGFDIANHFHEWCADYHHPTLSHSLTSHGAYPTEAERRRFYRAYTGVDNGYDGCGTEDPRWALGSPFLGPQHAGEEMSELSLDDQRELEDEAGAAPPGRRAREDERVREMENEVRVWSPASHAMWALWGLVQARDDMNRMLERWTKTGSQPGSPKSPDEIEFEYLSYSMERIILFRKEIEELGISA